MHLVLGHPTYALVFVLAGLLVATGVGSSLSPRLLKARASVSVAALVTAGILALLPWGVIGPLARLTSDSSLSLRAAWTLGCAGVVGGALGLFFPAGLRYVTRERATPLALAVNGATSVIGSIVAILVSVTFGISTTFVVGALAYLLVAGVGPWSWKKAPV
jgi:hypothetical protein